MVLLAAKGPREILLEKKARRDSGYAHGCILAKENNDAVETRNRLVRPPAHPAVVTQNIIQPRW